VPKIAPAPVQDAYERVNAAALALPGAEAKLSHGSPWFHVRGKMFLAFLDDHHGDGRLAVWCKSTLAEQRRLVAEDSARFFVPPYVGVKGWVGVRLDHPKTDWIELAILIEEGWRAVAPKKAKEGGLAAKGKPLRLPRTDPKAAREALDRLTTICAALPGADYERTGGHAAFRVGKKTFAYFLDNHHGDEKIAVSLKAAKGESAALVKRDPKRFYLPEYLGAKGWVAIRLDLGRVDWKDVAARLAASHAAVAPKRLLARR
jgi:hypothetical protein